MRGPAGAVQAVQNMVGAITYRSQDNAYPIIAPRVQSIKELMAERDQLRAELRPLRDVVRIALWWRDSVQSGDEPEAERCRTALFGALGMLDEIVAMREG